MIFPQGSDLMLKSILYNIKKDLESHHRLKSELLGYYVEERLNKSFESYCKELSSTIEYLQTKPQKTILNSVNRK